MTFALNEIEAMAKGAARGAGFDWGIAEETGKSVRWLAARGLPGPELLIKTLKRSESTTYSVAAPNITREPWMAPGWLVMSFVRWSGNCGLCAVDRSRPQNSTRQYLFPLVVSALRRHVRQVQ